MEITTQKTDGNTVVKNITGKRQTANNLQKKKEIQVTNKHLKSSQKQEIKIFKLHLTY